MTVPIVPGPDPYQPPTYQPSGTPDIAKKATVGTLTVILILVGVFCVLPMVLCVGWFVVFGGAPTRP